MILTTAQAAQHLGVTTRRIQAMLTKPCPACQGQGCDRCQNTGHKLPHTTAGRSGTGEIKLIHAWALDIPDIAHRAIGRTILPSGVTIAEHKGRYIVHLRGENVGAVYRVNRSRRSWEWYADDQTSDVLYRSRRKAIVDLLEQSSVEDSSSGGRCTTPPPTKGGKQMKS